MKIKEVAHIGLTVTNLDRSIAFYRDVLGLEFVGEIKMEGKETDLLFNRENASCRVAYLNGSKELIAPPIELICFDDKAKEVPSDLRNTSISEVCFVCEDIDAIYQHLLANNVVCLSAPQPFDFTSYGFSKSKALYFKDPDGIILELMEYLN